MSLRKRPNPGRQGKSKPRTPMSVRTVETVIDHLGGRGDGVARCGEDAVFIPFTVPGDRVVARIEGKRGDGLAAALVEVLEAGPGRVDPPCPHFARCGGCSVQHLDPALYAQWKTNLLLTPLKRVLDDQVQIDPLIQIGEGRRRRAAFAYHRRKGSTVLGFNMRSGHTIVDLESCLVLVPEITAVLPALRDVLTATIPEGEDGDVTVTLTETGLDVLVEGDARLDLFDREKLAAFADAADLARLSWRRPGGGFVEPIARRRAALVRFSGIAVEPPPGNFLQPTAAGELAIAQAAAAGIGAAAVVADLYCGCGSFTIPLAALGKNVHAVEGDEAPVRALEAAANAAGLKVSVEARDLARRPLTAPELARFDAVVFDPPRAGAAAQAEMLAQAGPAVIAAVSCNPATLARDLGILLKGGYRLLRLTPIDQFPYSAHLEAVAILRRG